MDPALFFEAFTWALASISPMNATAQILQRAQRLDSGFKVSLGVVKRTLVFLCISHPDTLWALKEPLLGGALK